MCVCVCVCVRMGRRKEGKEGLEGCEGSRDLQIREQL